MLAVRSLQRKVANQLRSLDAPPLSPGIAEKFTIKLVIAPFSPSIDLVASDLTYATTDGLDPKDSPTGVNSLWGIDPATQEQIVTIDEPAAGWLWQLTGVTGAPYVVYGFACFDPHTPANLLATELLPSPVTLTNIGDQLDIGRATFRCPAFPLS